MSGVRNEALMRMRLSLAVGSKCCTLPWSHPRDGAGFAGAAIRSAGKASDAAAAAFDRFITVHAEIITLSRRNSNVRSLALTLGNKQKATIECETGLQAIEAALSQHEFTATR